MLCLSIAKRGYSSRFDLVEVVNAILYKLKSGCQWRMLPIGHLFNSKGPSWKTVFHHYRKWCKKEEWQKIYSPLLSRNKNRFDLSLSHIDGSHTPVYRGGENSVSFHLQKSGPALVKLRQCRGEQPESEPDQDSGSDFHMK